MRMRGTLVSKATTGSDQGLRSNDKQIRFRWSLLMSLVVHLSDRYMDGL